MAARWFAPSARLRGVPGLPAFLIPAALAAAIAGAVASQPFVAGLAGLAAAVMTVSYLWARLSLEDVRYQRAVSADRAFVGDEIELTLSIDNRKPLPLSWLRVQDHVPFGLEVLDEPVERVLHRHASALTIATSLAWYERVRFKYRLRAARRGYHRFGPVQLESGDLFGVYIREQQRRETGPAIVVYPQTVPLPDFYLPPGRPLGEARTRMRAWEDPGLPSGLKEYRPGDSLRRIDWKATARRRELLVRTYDPSAEHHVVVIADMMTADHPWEGVSPPFLERAVTAAASVATRAFDLGYRVSLVTNGLAPAEAARTAAAADAAIGQLTAVLERLAMALPVTVRPVEDTIETERDAFPFGATVVAVSPLFRDGLRAKLADLRSRGHPVLAIYVGDRDLPETSLGYEVISMGETFDLEARAQALLFQPPERKDSASGYEGTGADV
ncbi:MAG: DUF58 domain-containing protein [Chloroflexi bacterium]|nr:DUF58 domain-containing protein [Chloroflexota bacterium]